MHTGIKDNFKKFVKQNPILLKHVQSGKMTWQKFYEMYDMYGEDENTWSPYLNNQVASNLGLFEFIKNLDLVMRVAIGGVKLEEMKKIEQ